MQHNIFDVCTPRKSTFDQDRRDVVLQLSDLFDGKYSQGVASSFFEENFVTNGMKVLVNKAFDRLNGINNQASTFLLSQSMGGGKTHNMIALGLLARFPQLRKTFWKDKDLGTGAANQARFKTPSEFKRSGLGGDGFGATILRHLLFAVHETARTDSPREGLNYLKAERPDYWSRRADLLAILGYLGGLGSHAGMEHWRADAEAAGLLAGIMTNDYAGR